MSDEEGLLKAVCDFPDDDLPRLAYADWCDENGDPERAEFVRGQIEIENVPRNDSGHCSYCGVRGQETHLEGCRVQRLLRREYDLLEGGRGWGLPAATAFGLTAWDDLLGGMGHDSNVSWSFRRGFVAVIYCQLDDWLGHGEACLAACPVERVEATDRAPDHGEDNLWYWYRGAPADLDESDHLPPDVFHQLQKHLCVYGIDFQKAYRSREAAAAALSDALIRLARPRERAP